MTRTTRKDRRLLIADTALKVLAQKGARGLTHRAIDEAAKLPPGSSSYYFPTRDALVAAAAERLCALDTADVARAIEGGGVARLLEQWSSRTHRHRLVARFELFLEATRNTATRRLIRAQRKGFLLAARRAFEDAGVGDAELHGALLVAIIDGLLLGQAVDPQPGFARIRRSVLELLGGRGMTRAKRARR